MATMNAARTEPPVVLQAAPPPSVGNLPRGYRLREFVIERVLGDGGFGVVYSAIDLRLERRVAIKEYMPSALATREADYSVQMLTSPRHRNAFEVGLRSFINEARLLARFEHPALIKVHQFWQEKGTAYMVMPFYAAPTLRTWIRSRTEPVAEAWLRSYLLAAMDALEALHAESCMHRDIAPDNMLVLDDGSPLLLDFGAARRVLGDLRRALTVIVKPGYAPLEQYADTVAMRQGPWTDVYALAAVAHFAITGHAPAPAVSRVLADEVVPLRTRAHGRYSDALLGAIDTALAVRPERRPQSIAAFRGLLLSTQAGEWEPTRLVVRAATVPAGLDPAAAGLRKPVRPASLPATPVASGDGEHVAPDATVDDDATVFSGAPVDEGDEPATTHDETVARTGTAERTLPTFAGAPASRGWKPATGEWKQQALTLVARLGAVARESLVRAHSVLRGSRWVAPAVLGAAGLACCGALAMTAYLVDQHFDVMPKPRVVAPVAAAPAVAAPPLAAAAVALQVPQAAAATPEASTPETRLSGTAAMAAAAPSEVTLAPARIEAPKSAAPVATAAAPARKSKSTPQRSVTTVERAAEPIAAAVLVPAAPAPKEDAPAAAKTRSVEPLVLPLERAAEIAQVAPVELVIAQPVKPAPLRALDRPQPEFPAAAVKEGVKDGRVLAQVQVNADGSIGRVDILEARPRSVFDREVRRALAGWRYEAPGEVRHTTVEFLFRLEQ
jgi:TonB family protein